MVRFMVLLLSAPLWLAAPERAYPQAAQAATLPTEGLVMGGALGALAGVGLARTGGGVCAIVATRNRAPRWVPSLEADLVGSWGS
jgi:hypothetical protein